MTATLQYTMKLHLIDCANCQIVFGITNEFYERRAADGRDFFCPSGHRNAYDGKQAALVAELAAAKRQLQWKEEARAAAVERATSAERRAAAAKGQVTKMKKRAAEGVCPAPGCKRTFSNLRAHIAGQHPELVTDAIADGAEQVPG